MKGYVIGNGFDLSHGMKTKYTDFYEYLKTNDSKNLEAFDYFYNVYDLWGNFEDNIGKIDYKLFISHMGSIYDGKSDKSEIRGDINSEDVDFDHIICNYEELIEDLKNWIETVELPQRKYVLSDKDIYLSFNYTSLLENVYSIDCAKILHIHGSVKDGDLILGYNNICVEKVLEDADCGIYTWEFPYEELGYELLSEYMCYFHKDTDAIIHRNVKFFKQLERVDELLILGISFSKTDIKYLDYIVTHIKNTTKIYISYFSRSDRMRISWFVRKHKLTNVTVLPLENIMQN